MSLREAMQEAQQGGRPQRKREPATDGRSNGQQQQERHAALREQVATRRTEFRKDKVAQLQAEPGHDADGKPVVTESKVDVDQQDDDQLARQPEDEHQAVEPSNQETDGPEDDEQLEDGAVAQEASEEATEGDDVESESEDDSPTAQLQQENKELQESYTELERNYRQKTHRLSESHRNLDQQMESVETSAKFYASLAEQGVASFDQVDWNALQANPQEYQKASRGYQQALQNRDRLFNSLKTLQQGNVDRRELMKKQESSVARDMLSHEIKSGWTRERFTELREYGVDKTGLYTEDEFTDITDWRVIKLLDRVEKFDSAPKTIDGLRVKGGKRKPKALQNAPKLDLKRDEKGRFAASREELKANPYNKQNKHQFFIDKLRVERASR